MSSQPTHECVCHLAGGGLTGLMDPVSPGYACGSDTAHMSILGYDPFMYVAHWGRTRAAAVAPADVGACLMHAVTTVVVDRLRPWALGCPWTRATWRSSATLPPCSR